jgi:heme oxygenase
VADADRLAMVGRPPTPARYTDYLARVYGFEAPLESALAVAPLQLDISRRMKASVLGDDLCALGFPADKILSLPCCELSPIRSELRALGWLFVSESNRAGHQVFRTYLSIELPDITRSNAERATSDQWRELDEYLGRTIGERVDLFEELLETVEYAYDLQHEWFRPAAPSGTVMRAAYQKAEALLRRT